jgi:hypothetical protein
MSSQGPAGGPADPELVKEFYENRVIDQRVWEENQRRLSQPLSPTITDPAQIGRLTSALSLLEGASLSVRVHGGKIHTQVLGTNRYKTFDTEYDLIVWLHESIRDSAQASIAWFQQHKEAFNGTTCASVRTESDK